MPVWPLTLAHTTVVTHQEMEELNGIWLLRTVESFQGFQSRLHVAHSDHSRDNGIWKMESHVHSNGVIMCGLHHSNTEIKWMINHSVECATGTKIYETTLPTQQSVIGQCRFSWKWHLFHTWKLERKDYVIQPMACQTRYNIRTFLCSAYPPKTPLVVACKYSVLQVSYQIHMVMYLKHNQLCSHLDPKQITCCEVL